LTGLHNRRYFHEMLARECARAHRYNRKLGLIVFDIDDFKVVNDRIGHLAGDAVLAEAASRVREVVHGRHPVSRRRGRVRGDHAGVRNRAGRAALRANPVDDRQPSDRSGGPAPRLRRPHCLKAEDDSISLFERADDALYRAKEAGKSQSVTANSGV